MVHYRRHRLPGGTFFFTVTLHDRRARLLTAYIDALRNALRVAKEERPFSIDAIVILPDHLHTIWTLPEDDDDYSGRWRAVKSRFSHTLGKNGVLSARNGRGEAPVWQRRYWEHTIRNDADRKRHIDYIHYNPVKHGLVQRPVDWPHSSFHRFTRQGMLPQDWGGDSISEDAGRFGE